MRASARVPIEVIRRPLVACQTWRFYRPEIFWPLSAPLSCWLSSLLPWRGGPPARCPVRSYVIARGGSAPCRSLFSVALVAILLADVGSSLNDRAATSSCTFFFTARIIAGACRWGMGCPRISNRVSQDQARATGCPRISGQQWGVPGSAGKNGGVPGSEGKNWGVPGSEGIGGASRPRGRPSPLTPSEVAR